MYVDPGSGSLLIQMLVAACIGIGFKLRAKIKALFKK